MNFQYELIRKHPQFAAVDEIQKKLRAAGYVVYLAGGCVRDAILRVQPQDLDLVTNAKPHEIEKLVGPCLEVGKSFGITIAVIDREPIEIATFREDGPYVDGRRPETIQYSTPEKDAQRRDFTVNGLFWDFETEKVIDFVNGQADIKSRLLRAVGNPRTRFLEDHLRILRLFRFAAQLNFQIDAATEKAAFAEVPLLKHVSWERVRAELERLLTSQQTIKGIELLVNSQALKELSWVFDEPKVYLPEWQEIFRERIFDAVDAWTRFFWVIAAKNPLLLSKVRSYLKLLKFSRDFEHSIMGTLQLLGQLKPDTELKNLQKILDPYFNSALRILVQGRMQDGETGQFWVKEQRRWKALHSVWPPDAWIRGNDVDFVLAPERGVFLKSCYLQQVSGKWKSQEEARALLEDFYKSGNWK